MTFSGVSLVSFCELEVGYESKDCLSNHLAVSDYVCFSFPRRCSLDISSCRCVQGILGVIQIIVYLSCKLKNTPPLIFPSAYMTLEEQKLH